MSTPGGSGALQVEIEQTQPMPLKAAFSCAPGELLALVGPSGAGKTSVLRALAGLMRPARGRVQVGADPWFDSGAGLHLPPQQRHVGLVFQQYALMPHLRALDDVALSLLHLPRAERRARAARWLDHMRLTPEQQLRRPAQLSGGQQQRVAVARALAREPRLLLLDEPFSAVDQSNRQGLYQLLADLRRELAVPIVLVTHDLNEARLLADRLVVMDAGQVLQQGSPESVHRAPRNARVADLVGIHNRHTGLWLGPADAPGWGWLQWLTDEADASSTLRLRVRDKGRIAAGTRVSWILPGDALTLVAEARPAGDDGLACVVGEARHLGEMTLATLDVAGAPGAALRMTLTGAQRLQLAVGQAVGVRLDLSAVHVMPVK